MEYIIPNSTTLVKFQTINMRLELLEIQVARIVWDQVEVHAARQVLEHLAFCQLLVSS